MLVFDQLIRICKTAITTPKIAFEWLRDKMGSGVEWVQNLSSHLKNLRGENIKLGIYHLEQGNLKDAKIRFWLTNKLFAPNDPENLYWYSWALLLSGEYQEAIAKLTLNLEDKIGLKNYLLNYTTLRAIPHPISNQYFGTSFQYYFNRYQNEKVSVIDDFVGQVIPLLNQNNESETKPNILEIGASAIIGSELRDAFGSRAIIEAIDFYPSHLKLVKEINKTEKIYNNLDLSEQNFAAIGNKKYNLIVAFDSLSTNLDLATQAKNIKNMLEFGGHFALVLPLGFNNRLIPSNNHFTFERSYVEEQLLLADFTIKSINISTVQKDSDYLIIIAI